MEAEAEGAGATTLHENKDGSCKVFSLLNLEGLAWLSTEVPFVDAITHSKYGSQDATLIKGCELCAITRFFNKKQQREHFEGKRHLAVLQQQQQVAVPEVSGEESSDNMEGVEEQPKEKEPEKEKGREEANNKNYNKGGGDAATEHGANEDELMQMFGFSQFRSTRPPGPSRNKKKKGKKHKKKGKGNIWESGAVPFGKDNFGYWAQRYRLFSKFDEGIKMDQVGWYSVTPELIAAHTAARVHELSPGCTVVDAFCGVGGNAIQFALWGFKTYAIELDEERLEMAKHNAQVYGVKDKIEWIHGDCLEVLPTLKADVVFLSPPWGGPQYKSDVVFDLKNIEPDFETTFFKSLSVTRNIVALLPRNSDTVALQNLAYQSHMLEEVKKKFGKTAATTPELTPEHMEMTEGPPWKILMEVENNFINKKRNSMTVYFGDFKYDVERKTSEVLEKMKEEWERKSREKENEREKGAEAEMEEEEEEGEAVELSQEEQEECEANTKLRERMLTFWMAMMGKSADISMFESTRVTGKLGGIDGRQEYMHIAGLQTPMYRYPEATVRVSDVLMMRFDGGEPASHKT